MEYVVVRLYKAGAHNSDEALRAASQELAPRLMQQQDILRYTLFRIDDRRYGSTTLCRDQQAVDAGNDVAADWVRGHAVMQGARMTQRLQGERFFAYQGRDTDSLKGAIAVMRIVSTTASRDDLKATFEQELTPIYRECPGVLRVSVFQHQANALVNLATYRTPSDYTKATEKVGTIRKRSGTMMNQFLPADPEITEATIYDSFARS